jgi:hypothetical protein
MEFKACDLSVEEATKKQHKAHVHGIIFSTVPPTRVTNQPKM